MDSCNFKRFVNETKNTMKLMEKALEWLLKMGGRGGMSDIPSTRIKMDRAAKWLMPKVKQVTFTYETIQGVPVAWVKPVAAASKVLLYLHGGAYVTGSIETHKNLAGTLVRQAGIQALVLDYRLAPEHPYPAAMEDVVAVYRYLLENGYTSEDIAIGGDSAGGGLSVAVLLYLRDHHLPLPNCAILLCPWLDLTNTSATYQINKDIMLRKEDLDHAVRNYTAGKESITHPYVSPLYGRMKGLPPVLIHTGGRDVLQGEGMQFVASAREEGVSVEHFNEPNGIHVWHAYYPFLNHAKTANAMIADYLRKQFQNG